MKTLLFALAPMLLFAATAAEARPARCVIASAGNQTWRGPCDFQAEQGGSFSVSPMRGSFPGGISDISVSMVGGGVAEVRGLTSRGINSRWGEARRSSRDRACWIGSDFSVCAY